VPSWGEMYSRTKLMRRTEMVKVPTYKWVTEDVCCNCLSNCDCCDLPLTEPNEQPQPAAGKAK
jgi:hypothetical protein